MDFRSSGVPQNPRGLMGIKMATNRLAENQDPYSEFKDNKELIDDDAEEAFPTEADFDEYEEEEKEEEFQLIFKHTNFGLV